MNEMVERVAKAIYVNEYDDNEYPWDTRVPAVAGSYRRDARAAIEAMREHIIAAIEAERLPPEDSLDSTGRGFNAGNSHAIEAVKEMLEVTK